MIDSIKSVESVRRCSFSESTPLQHGRLPLAGTDNSLNTNGGNMKTRQYEMTRCPRCGNEEEVTKGALLVACWRCAMCGADSIESKRLSEQREYDWRATLSNIKKAERIKTKEIAWRLKIRPDVLSAVKASKRSMPKQALDLVKDIYSKHLVMVREN